MTTRGTHDGEVTQRILRTGQYARGGGKKSERNGGDKCWEVENVSRPPYKFRGTRLRETLMELLLVIQDPTDS